VPCGCRGPVEHALQRRRPDDDRLRQRLKALAKERGLFGYRRLWVLLWREGHAINRRRVYRLYKEEPLMVRRGSVRLIV
jgi:putative transposase